MPIGLPMADDQHQFKDRYMLRLPDGMRDRIRAAATTRGRSMNAEIVATLEEAYPPPRRLEELQDLTELFLDYLPPPGTSDKAFADEGELEALRALLKNLNERWHKIRYR